MVDARAAIRSELTCGCVAASGMVGGVGVVGAEAVCGIGAEPKTVCFPPAFRAGQLVTVA